MLDRGEMMAMPVHCIRLYDPKWFLFYILFGAFMCCSFFFDIECSFIHFFFWSKTRSVKITNKQQKDEKYLYALCVWSVKKEQKAPKTEK